MKKITQTLLLTICLLEFKQTCAQAGSLDLTFSTDGKVTTTIYGKEEIAGSVVIQSDEKIVTAGYALNDSDHYEFALIRYDANGSLDTSFSNDGKVTTSFYGTDDTGTSIAIQSDGKIVMTGYIENSNGIYEIGVARYNTDGSLDTSFGVGGKVTTSIFGISDGGYAVAIQTDQKILVAGEATDSTGADLMVVLRYNTDGSLDTSFDIDGTASTSINGFDGTATSIAIQSDGQIVLAGFSDIGNSNEIVLVRYNTNGSLDTSFDTDGIVTTSINGADDEAFSIAIQTDGKIVITGSSESTSGINEFVIVRYNSDGSLDSSFDTDGKVTTSINGNEDIAYSLAIQSDGKIVVVGTTVTNLGTIDIALVCYNVDGSLAASFDSDGKVTVAIDALSIGVTVKIQPDGKIVVAGGSISSMANMSFCAARFNGTSTGINDHEDMMGLMIYPNPFTNDLNIVPASTIASEKFEIRIKDVLGKSVLAANYDNLPIEGISLNLENLTNGVYFLEINNDNERVSKKIIKE